MAFDAVEELHTDLVVNATPLGADGRTRPPLPALGPGVLVVDLLYRPAQTPLTREVRSTTPPPDGVRVAKLMTERGLASRREADEWIEAGLVRTGGDLVQLGQRVAPDTPIET